LKETRESIGNGTKRKESAELRHYPGVCAFFEF
jgi:hypothetical protein